MASLACPNCGATMSGERTWAQAAVSTLIAAPAVPDMATQVRCDKCGHVAAASEFRHVVADRFSSKRTVGWALAAALVASALAWALLR